MKNLLCGLLTVCMAIAWSQARAQNQQESTQELKRFAEVRVDSAQDAIRSSLFRVTLLKGVLLAVQNAPEEEIKAVFEEAVRADPRGKLEKGTFSPQLEAMLTRFPRLPEIFREVRDELVGCVWVSSEPIEAEMLKVEGDSVLFKGTTPSLLCDLAANPVQIVFTKHGFEQNMITVQLQPGRSDTLLVTLKPEMMAVQAKAGRQEDTVQVALDHSTFRAPRRSKWQRWFWSGIAVAGVATVAAAVISESGPEKVTEVIQELPEPPVRPVP